MSDPESHAGGPAPDAPQPEARDTEPGQGLSMRVYTIVLGAVGAAAVVGGYLWRGVDFAGAVLLGFAVVALNLLWTKNLIRSMLQGSGAYRALMFGSYLAKFGLTAVVLYVAIVRYEVDPIGILLGLSALVVATVLFAHYAASRP